MGLAMIWRKEFVTLGVCMCGGISLAQRDLVDTQSVNCVQEEVVSVTHEPVPSDSDTLKSTIFGLLVVVAWQPLVAFTGYLF